MQTYAESTSPLRIMNAQESAYLASPYEITADNLTAHLINPHIAHIQLIATDSEFKRHFFYSRTDSKHL